MVINTRIFLLQIHPMYHITSLGYGGSEENAQLLVRALVVAMFHSTNFRLSIFDMIESVGLWNDAPTTPKFIPINSQCINGEFLFLWCMGVYWLFQNEAILLFFVLHFPLLILTKLSLFLFSSECSWDYAMQITAM